MKVYMVFKCGLKETLLQINVSLSPHLNTGIYY